MRLRTLGAGGLAALTLALASCSDGGVFQPSLDPDSPSLSSAAVAAPPAAWISEFHYDNGGADSGEFVEVMGAADTSLEGWQIVLYNGNGGAAYDTEPLSGIIPGLCGDRGVISFAIVGSERTPDGIALVDASGAVVEAFSYEGSFTAVGGPADGMLLPDIGVSQSGSGTDTSLQRGDDGTWLPEAAATRDACNGGPPVPAAEVAAVTVAPSAAGIAVGDLVSFGATGLDADGNPVATSFTWESADPAIASIDASTGLATGVAAGEVTITATSANGVEGTAVLTVSPAAPVTEVRISEIHYDNAGTDEGEAIELSGPSGTDLTGWQLVLYNGSNGEAYGSTDLTALSATCGATGYLVVSYPSNGIQNGSPDAVALVDAAGTVVEFLSYEGTLTAVGGPADGRTSADIGAAEPSTTPAGQSLHRASDGTWHGPAASTFGPCDAPGGPGGGGASVSIFGRDGGDPPLPVGFQDQLFARLSGDADATFTWSSETGSLASVDGDGVVTALAAGTAVIRATAASGETATFELRTLEATPGGTAQYEGNVEFGLPTDASPADDFVISRPQYTASYNVDRGTPNWVSYNLEATHFGSQDRCDCFTPDPALPDDYPVVSTADYTNSGAFAGYGIDRGHLVRSFDRTTGSLDNAVTYYFSNIVPQAADNNQGPWSDLEFYLGDLARLENREVYIVAGVAGSLGTLKDEGKVVIPESVWKVAVVLPRDQGLEAVDDISDLEVIAVNMPNTPGIREVDWETFRTSVDEIEAITGYDLLDLLPDAVEGFVERGGSYAALEAAFEALSLSVEGAVDDGTARSLQVKLDAAWKSIGKGNPTPAANQLGAFRNEVVALASSGRLSPAQAADLTAAVDGILAVLRD